MNVKQAQKELEKRRAVVTELVREKESVLQTLDALQKERSAAVRALAMGDEAQRKVIVDLETKIH